MSQPRHPYAGLFAVLATKHDKVSLVGPALSDVVGMTVTEAAVDTDTLGTFSGEVERRGTPWQTAVAKAHLGLEHCGGRLGLASEGSIGPHPAVPFLVAATELVVMVDTELGLVIGETAVGFDVRTVSATVAPGDPLDGILARGDIPNHALIVRPAMGEPVVVGKGLRYPADIESWIRRASRASPDGRAIVETDLRAHLCPSRRPVIARAAHSLARRLAVCCPSCGAPGWGVVSVEPGAPCEECSAPTELPLAQVWGCAGCEATDRRLTGTKVDPARCQLCNP